MIHRDSTLDRIVDGKVHVNRLARNALRTNEKCDCNEEGGSSHAKFDSLDRVPKVSGTTNQNQGRFDSASFILTASQYADTTPSVSSASVVTSTTDFTSSFALAGA